MYNPHEYGYGTAEGDARDALAEMEPVTVIATYSVRGSVPTPKNVDVHSRIEKDEKPKPECLRFMSQPNVH